MKIVEAFDQPYKLDKTSSFVSILLKKQLEDKGCQYISIYKVVDILQSNIYIISYVYDDAIETHIVNEDLLMGGTNKRSQTFKRSEFSRLVASSIVVTKNKAKNHNLPIRFWSDDVRKTNIYKAAISKFNDVEIHEEPNYRTINGDTRTVYIVTKKDKQ